MIKELIKISAGVSLYPKKVTSSLNQEKIVYPLSKKPAISPAIIGEPMKKTMSYQPFTIKIKLKK